MKTHDFVQSLCFLETTNLASSYLKTCFTVKIWLYLMNTNLITRLIQATVPVPGGGGGGIGWIFFTNYFHSMILDTKLNSASFGPK